ncbi:MAG: hypothetical protein ACMXX6_01940 [Candidatus Woesearchaeota archaeon]
MKDLFFIGTLHLGLTNLEELIGFIKDFDPELILVEIVNDDIKSNNLVSYPVEMVYVLKYCNLRNIKVKGFDISIDVLNKDLSNDEVKAITRRQVDFIKDYSWIDFNKPSFIEKLNSLSGNLFDKSNWDFRQEKMKSNIKNLSNSKRCVVVCGASHIPFFKKEFEKAKFL